MKALLLGLSLIICFSAIAQKAKKPPTKSKLDSTHVEADGAARELPEGTYVFLLSHDEVMVLSEVINNTDFSYKYTQSLNQSFMRQLILQRDQRAAREKTKEEKKKTDSLNKQPPVIPKDSTEKK